MKFVGDERLLIFNEDYLDLIDEQPVSGNRKSFDRFLEQLPKYIREYYLPMLNDKCFSSSSTVWIDKEATTMNPILKHEGMEDINVKGVNKLESSDYYIPVRINVKFNITDKEDRGRPVNVMNLPFISREGLLYWNGKVYNFINSMEIDDTIVSTKKRGETVLKLVNGMNSFTLSTSKREESIILEMFKTKINSLYIASLLYIEDYGLTHDEVLDDSDIIQDNVEYIHNLYMDFEMGNYYEGIIDCKNALELRIGCEVMPYDSKYQAVFGDAIMSTTSKFDFVNYYLSGRFSLSDSRESIDKMCSFDNLIGESLAEHLVLSSMFTGRETKEVYPVGTVITKRIVSELNYSRVDKVRFIRNNYLSGDCFLAENLVLPSIPINTKLSGSMKDRFSDYVNLDGDTTTETFVNPMFTNGFDLTKFNPFIFTRGTKVDKDFCDLIRSYNNSINHEDPKRIQKVRYSKKASTFKNNHDSKPSKDVARAIYTHWFDAEVFYSNRVYPLEDLHVDSVSSDDDIDLTEMTSWYPYAYVDRYGNVKQVSTNLTFHDLISILHIFDLIRRNVKVDTVPDADTSFRKKIKQIEHRFQEAFIYAVEQANKTHLYDVTSISKGLLPDDDIMVRNSGIFSTNFFRYLQEKEVIQQVDFTNPLSVLSGVTKANTLCKPNSVPDSVRRITTGHFARICPYETPQSKKLGVVNNITTTSIIEDGYVKAALYKIDNRDRERPIIDMSRVHYLSVIEQERFRIGDIKSIDFDANTGVINNPNDIVISIIPDLSESYDKQDFNKVPVKYLDYVTTSVNASCSHVASTVPFIGANDSTRITFGVSMAKQTKSLVNGEKPIVATTAFHNIARLLRSFAIVAESDGIVQNILERQIIVKYDEPFHGDICPIRYKYKPIIFSTYTVSIMTPNVKVGDRFKKGDILVSSNFIKEGSLVTGVNALITYIPNGYNYEDGVFASERLSTKLTSFGPSHQDTQYERDKRPSLSKFNMRRYIEKDSDNNNICLNSISVYKNGVLETVKLKDLDADTFKGFYYDYEQIIPNGSTMPTALRVKGITVDRLNASDKICNRHGNKGVSCYIMKTSNMPYLNNGETLDILYNPCGIVSRMNTGQVLEAHIGLACIVLGIRAMSPAFYGASLGEITDLVAYAHYLANSKDDSELDEIFSKYSHFPKELHENCKQNISSIRVWADTFDQHGLAYVYDTETGEQSERKCVIGVNYIYKLVQEGSHKIADRGGMVTETYVKATQSPTKGIDKGGGQSEGRMELDIMFSYGVSDFMYETMNYRSDDYVRRSNWTVEQLLEQYAYMGGQGLIKDDTHAMRRSVEYMFSLLMALGLHSEMDEKEIFHKREYFEKRMMAAASDDLMRKHIADKPGRLVDSDFTISKEQSDALFGGSSKPDEISMEDMLS